MGHPALGTESVLLASTARSRNADATTWAKINTGVFTVGKDVSGTRQGLVTPLEFRVPPATMRHYRVTNNVTVTALIRSRHYVMREGNIPAGFDRLGGTPETRFRFHQFFHDDTPFTAPIPETDGLGYASPPQPASPPHAFFNREGTFFDTTFAQPITIADLYGQRIHFECGFTFGEVTAAMFAAQGIYSNAPLQRRIQIEQRLWFSNDGSTLRRYLDAKSMNITGLEYCPQVDPARHQWGLTPQDDFFPEFRLDVGACISPTTVTTFAGTPANEQVWRFAWGQLWPELALRVKNVNFDNIWLFYTPENDTWNGRSPTRFVPTTIHNYNTDPPSFFKRTPFNYYPGGWPASVTISRGSK